MDYQRIYDELIEAASSRPAPDCYTEKHHIIPRSHGGSDSADNMVVLTAREHFVAHWLLWRIHRSPAMASAFMFMCGNGPTNSRPTPTSHAFEAARAALSVAGKSEETKNKLRGNDNAKGAKRSKEWKANQSAWRTGVAIRGYGWKQPAETKAKIGAANSVALKGRKQTTEHIAKATACLVGRPVSAATRAKSAASNRNATPAICPHCQATGHPGYMKRWHFDSCPEKPGNLTLEERQEASRIKRNERKREKRRQLRAA